MSLNRYATRSEPAISLDLPWPSRTLHPNARPHYMAKARATKSARTQAALVAKSIGRLDVGAIKVTAIFSPPPLKRNRDLDNMLASIKAYFDGIADAVGIDDSKFQHQAPEWGEPVKGGNVRIVIEADTWEHISGPADRVLDAIRASKRSAA